jgi:hypothetical protein
MIGIIVIIEGGIDAEIDYDITHQLIDIDIIDIIDMNIQRRKYRTLTEVYLSFLFI